MCWAQAAIAVGSLLLGNELQKKETRRQEDRFDKKQAENKAYMEQQQQDYDTKIKELTAEEENPLLVSNQYQKGKKGMDMLKVKKPTMGKGTSVGGMNSQTGINIAT